MRLQAGVGTIAEGRLVGVLAGTEGHLLLGFQGEPHGGEVCPLMAPIAEGLVGGLATGTPVVIACFQRGNNGLGIGNNRISHGDVSRLNNVR